MSKDHSVTYGSYKCKVLQHHTEVQLLLSCTKELPFFLGEGNAHIVKGCTVLTWLEQEIYDQFLSQELFQVEPTLSPTSILFLPHVLPSPTQNGYQALKLLT
jgi:hypothetical protein